MESLNSLASQVLYDIVDRAIKRGNVKETLHKIGTYPYGLDAAEYEIRKIAESIKPASLHCPDLSMPEERETTYSKISGKGKNIRIDVDVARPPTEKEMYDELSELRAKLDLKNSKIESLEDQIRLLRQALKNHVVASYASSVLICELSGIKVDPNTL